MKTIFIPFHALRQQFWRVRYWFSLVYWSDGLQFRAVRAGVFLICGMVAILGRSSVTAHIGSLMIINVLLGVAVAGFIVEDLFVLAALYHEQKLKDYREGAHADYWMIIVSVPFIVMAAAMVAFYILLTVSNDMKMYTELTATLIGCALMIPAAWLIVDLLRFRASDQVTNR